VNPKHSPELEGGGDKKVQSKPMMKMKFELTHEEGGGTKYGLEEYEGEWTLKKKK